MLCAGMLVVAALPAHAVDELQSSFAFAEALAPVAMVFAQGASTLPTFAAFGGGVALLTTPNVLLLINNAAGNAELTRLFRNVSFWIDAVAAGGAFVFGVASMAGLFGFESELRAQGALYIGISLPLAIAAIVDLLPYAVESRLPDSGLDRAN